MRFWSPCPLRLVYRLVAILGLSSWSWLLEHEAPAANDPHVDAFLGPRHISGALLDVQSTQRHYPEALNR